MESLHHSQSALTSDIGVIVIFIPHNIDTPTLLLVLQVNLSADSTQMHPHCMLDLRWEALVRYLALPRCNSLLQQ